MAALEMRKAAASTAKAVGTLRETVQDFLVPELREIKASLDSLREELRLRADFLAQQDITLREEMRLRDSSLREEIRLRDEKQRELIQSVSDRFSRDVTALSNKLDTALDIRERLIALEARLPRVQ